MPRSGQRQPKGQHVYHEGTYSCRLHQVRCFAKVGDRGRSARCNLKTSLHPLCRTHASIRFGVEVFDTQRSKNAQAPVCGLRATQPFMGGDLIVPYLGFHGTPRNVNCPQARGARHCRNASPYTMPLDDRVSLDAACYRSYASMINHAGQFRLFAEPEMRAVVPMPEPPSSPSSAAISYNPFVGSRGAGP